MSRVSDSLVLVGLIVLIVWCGVQPAVGQTDEPPSPPSGLAAAATAADRPILLREPETAEAAFDTVVLMVDFAKLDLAHDYLHQLMAMNPNDAALLKMREKHGPTMFLKLSNIRELQPESIQLLDRMNAAFRKAATDPTRIDRLISDLTGSPQKREAAIIQLRSTGPIIVPQFIRRIASPSESGNRDEYVSALGRLGHQMVPALLGVLAAPEPGLKTAAAEVLGWIGDRSVIVYLLYPAFSADQTAGVRSAARRALAQILYGSPTEVNKVSGFGAAAELVRVGRLHFQLEHPWKTDGDKTVAFWSWDDQAGTVTPTRLSPEIASLKMGIRFAQQALILAPEDRDTQALYLALRLAEAAYRTGWDQPLPTGPGTAYDLALRSGADVVEAALALALRNPSPACAVACLGVLSQIETRHQLYRSQSDVSPLVAALNSPDPRVQFAAAGAILQLDPVVSFRGSTRVVSILQRALADGGTARALTVDPNSQRSSTVAGIVRELGYEPLNAKTGRDGFRVAAERGDVELILLHENTVQWDLSQTIANLRADARTANIPIAIYGPDPNDAGNRRLMQQYPLVTYVVETTSSTDLKGQLKPFLSQLKTPPLTQKQRREQIDAAAFWLGHIANGRRTAVFDIAPAEPALLQATTDPAVADNALFALAAVPSRTAQAGLMETATNEQLDSDIRESAALQLAFHIQRFGLLLSDDQVRGVHTAWKKATDAPVKSALSSVIGSLKPNAREVSQRLLEFSPAAQAVP